MNEHIISLKNSSQPTPTPTPTREPEPTQKKRRGNRLFAAFFTLIAMAIVFVGCYALYTNYIAKSVTSSVANSSGDTQQVVDKVSKLMLLPDETPTLAVVSDLEKLKGQAFFANAKEGDVVLMFAHAQKAVLYSPTLNKIIEVAPITNAQ